MDEIALNLTRVKLASMYGVSPDHLLLDIQPGSVILRVTIVSAPGSTTPLPGGSLAQVQAHIAAANHAALSAALGVNATQSSNVALTTQNSTSVEILVEAGQPLSCDPGFWCGTGSPLPCAPGRVAPNASSATCVPCAAGKFQEDSAQTACETCPSGHYCPLGSSAARACSKGTYRLDVGASSSTQCKLCDLGHFCGGATDPQPCPPGTHGGGLTGLSSVFCNDTCQIDETPVGPRQRVTIGGGAVNISACVCQARSPRQSLSDARSHELNCPCIHPTGGLLHERRRCVRGMFVD